MNLLPDTQLLVQAADLSAGPRALDAARLLGDPNNRLHFSAASIWEVAIKFALGRPDFTVDPRSLRRGLLDNGYFELPVTALHGAAVATLPRIHKDPFDRLLVAQATVEGLTLLTTDVTIARYPGPIRAV